MLSGFFKVTQLVRSEAIILIWGFLYSLNYTREAFQYRISSVSQWVVSGEGQVIMVMDIRIK